MEIVCSYKCINALTPIFLSSLLFLTQLAVYLWGMTFRPCQALDAIQELSFLVHVQGSLDTLGSICRLVVFFFLMIS